MDGRRPRWARPLAALLALAMAVGVVLPSAEAARGHAAAPAVANPELLRGLSAAERAMLAGNGFVVTAPLRTRGQQAAAQDAPFWVNNDAQHAVYWQFYDLYGENFRTGIPNFVTADAALHTFYTIYDNTLVVLERQIFVPDLRHLSGGLLDSATYQYSTAKEARLQEATRLNLGYVAVAARLLDPKATVPAAVAGPVNRELALIGAHNQFAVSPLFGRQTDYSQFTPRGHYAGDETLSRYFQAMMWYARARFALTGDQAAVQTRQALLLVRSLTLIPALGKLWARIFDPITDWVGRSDDLTIRDYQAVMARVYPVKAPLSVLADDARLARFIALARALPGPRINDQFVYTSKQAAQATGLRLFGQRFTADSAIIEALIYDKVGTREQPRLWPSGLDVAAGLGSARAQALQTRRYQQDRYAGYTQALTKVQRSYSALPASTWGQNLYWSWLDTLRAVWGPVPPAAPGFMRNDAWSTKSVATGLGSWAELRHATVLYAKQPMGGLGGGGLAPPRRDAYVEPVPLVYTRLLAMVQKMKATLAGEGILDTLKGDRDQTFTAPTLDILLPPVPRGETGYRAALDAFAGLVSVLERVSERELLNQPISSDDQQAIQRIQTDVQLIDTFFQRNAFPTDPRFYDLQVARIADVFTEPRSQQVLETGVGDILPIYVVVSLGGRSWVARGGVYSYYEFHWPISNRLTDQAWRAMPTRPALPDWTSTYISQ